jgi:pyridoxal phosphate enzyme (YggS family)
MMDPPMIMKKRMGVNLRRVQECIVAAAARAGRDATEVTLVAVTKTQPPETIQAAYELGLRDFAENRLEEAEAKFDLLPEDVRWHMVGHVQSRKASRAVGPYALVHSVDSVKLARRLDRFANKAGRIVPILLEVNVSGEPSKYGLDPTSVVAVAEAVLDLDHLRIQGLMTMAPVVPNQELARPVFAALREVGRKLQSQYPHYDWHHLSMGMTDDYEVAVEEGATIVRIGRAIFGERR